MMELVTGYLAALESRGRTPATIRATRADLRQFQQWWETTALHLCTQLVTNGAPLAVVATLLGHRSLTTTAISTKPSSHELARWTDTLALN